MIRHCVLLKWRDDATAEQRHAVLDGLTALPGLIPEIRAYTFGADASLVTGNHDLAVVADFDDAAGFHTYATHPDHVRVIDERIKPILAERVAVQFVL